MTKKHIVPQVKDKLLCCGCGACEAVCSVNAITMEMERSGFIYPVLDALKCISCGKCTQVCVLAVFYLSDRKE